MRTSSDRGGAITRVRPVPRTDKRNIVRRAAGFVGFSALAGLQALRGGRSTACWRCRRRSPWASPAGACTSCAAGPLVFNVQDVFPDAAVAHRGDHRPRGHRRRPLARAGQLPTRRRGHRAVGDDLRANVAAKMPAGERGDVRVIPNFVDTDGDPPARPEHRATAPSSASATSRW